MRAPAALLLVATALVLGACGDDDGGGEDAPTTAEYTSELDVSCAAEQEFIETLPFVQVDEELSAAEVEDLTMERNKAFIAGVAALEPPQDLADTHDELVELLETDPQTTSTTPDVYYGDLAVLYEALGADGCAEIAADAERLLSD